MIIVFMTKAIVEALRYYHHHSAHSHCTSISASRTEDDMAEPQGPTHHDIHGQALHVAHDSSSNSSLMNLDSYKL